MKTQDSLYATPRRLFNIYCHLDENNFPKKRQYPFTNTKILEF